MGNRVRYPIHQSLLYRLTSKRRLAEALKTDVASLRQLATGTQYNEFVNDRGRKIEHPIGRLGLVHKRIAKLLARIELPDYVHAQKGHSYVTNAKAHLGDVPVIKTDLTAYYPSVKFQQVFNLFLSDFQCQPDIAWLLARICTVRGEHVPTGSEISGIVAYLASRKMFDEIHDLAVANDCKMTCYVDDIVLSGPQATKRLLVQVRRIAKRHGMNTKDKKSKTYAAHAVKTITGCIVRGNRLLLPNARRKMIIELRRELMGNLDDARRSCAEASLNGRIQEARQIEPLF